MPSIYEQAQKFRASLIARDTAAIELLSNQYAAIYARLSRQLNELNSQIAEAQGAGQAVSRNWLVNQWRYQSFLRDLQREMEGYGSFVAQVVQSRQFFEANQGAVDAAAMVGSATPSVQGAFNRLPVGALQNIVANLQSTSPLGRLLDGFGSDASDKVKSTLRDAIALGWNPRKSAREVRDALGVPLSRALLISRTEGVRAYRQASLDSYQSSDVVTGWRWVAAKSARTCLSCLALDGTFFPKSKPFPAHPACRCTMVPDIQGVPQSKRETAGQWFERQDDEVKKKMMSGVAYENYKAGKIKLSDFIGHANSRKWGPMTYERSVREILAS